MKSIKQMLQQCLLMLTLLVIISACSRPVGKDKSAPVAEPIILTQRPGEGVATFASGCFWCVEEVFESLEGVRESISGYAGGSAEDATYEKVSSGSTGHAESVQIYYDSSKISFKELLDAFFASHDPTTLNQQGPDRGTQYRSVAFYRNETERAIIQHEIDSLNATGEFPGPIVTEVDAFTAFYPAEDYHQGYVENHPNEPYVRGVSIPRFEKFKKEYKGKLKE